MLSLPKPDPYGDGLQLTAAARLDAVDLALSCAPTEATVARVEDFLHAALERARRREADADWIRDGLARCAAKREEIATEGRDSAAAQSAIIPRG